MKITCFKFLPLLIVALIFPYPPSLIAQTLKAVDDTVILYPGIPKTVNLMGNDTVPAGDSLKIVGGNASGPNPISANNLHLGFFTYTVVPYWGFNGTETGIYTIIDYTTGKTSSAHILFRVHDRSYDTLGINNVRAAITAWGNEFSLWGSGESLFRVPGNTANSTVFNLAPWIGGKGKDGTLYFAGERYRQGPHIGIAGLNPDFYAGPIMDSVNYSIYQDTVWSRVWKIRKSEIDYHKAHWNEEGYDPPPNILAWPGNGTIVYGQAPTLAPYHDSNSDGNYNASDGDYPSIPGDEAIYAIFNDDRDVHKETFGNKMKVEIHAMAYAFDMPGDSALKNTIFFNYKVFNRSGNTYYDTYLGIFSDIDIGYPLDDYISCDVERNSFIGYNATMNDGHYGVNPPAQSVTILGGPLMDPSGTDRPRFDLSGHQICDESVNGKGFGDNMPDNEHYGMTNFLSLKSTLGQYYFMSDPNYDHQYYAFMQSIWLDSARLSYGGLGHPGYGGYGPDCRFIYPGGSDTLNWGAGCQEPNGPVYWTAKTGGDNPDDIRGLAAMGPFTFHPGDVQELDIALVFARDYSGEDTTGPSLGKLRRMIDIVRNAYNTGILPNGKPFLGFNENSSYYNPGIKIFPNPAREKLDIEFSQPVSGEAEVKFINLTGMVVRTDIIKLHGRSFSTDIKGLHPGSYIIQLRTKDFSANERLMIIR